MPNKKARKKTTKDEEDVVECPPVASAGEDHDCDASVNDEFNVDEFKYLVGTLHYDKEDKGVFRCERVVAEDFDDGNGTVVVVYRCKYDQKKCTWGMVNEDDPIQVADIVSMQKDASKNQSMIKKILR